MLADLQLGSVPLQCGNVKVTKICYDVISSIFVYNNSSRVVCCYIATYTTVLNLLIELVSGCTKYAFLGFFLCFP